MMVLLQLRTSFKAIRKPGKSGPAVFAFWDPGPPLQGFTKNIEAKAKPSASISPFLDIRAEGFAKPMSSEPAPVASALDRHTGRDPSRPSFTLSCRLQSYTRQAEFFVKLNVRSCRMPCSAGKTTLERQNACKKAQSGGYCRSTEFVIVVPTPSWRNIFLQKKCHQQKGETRQSFGQQST